MSEIVAITTRTRRYYLGDLYSTKRLTETTMLGQCASVPWVRVHRYDGSFVDCNVALLESIEYRHVEDDGAGLLSVLKTLDALAEQMKADGYPPEAIEKIRGARDFMEPPQVRGG